jgi:hypothetical protein
MAIDFPNSPATNSTHTVGGKTWKYDGEKWIAVVVTEPISLGLETNGNYVQSLNAGTGVTINNNVGEGATPTISIGQDVSESATPTFYTLETTQDLFVGGDLYVTGTLITTTETSLAIEDPFVYLNNGATPGNPDMGFAGNYNDGTYRHAGFFRDASDNTFKAFYGYEPELGSPINTSHGTYQDAAILGEKFISTVATGTAPLTVTSTTEVINLHADTASSLHTARDIQLSGEVTGTASFDGSTNINITTSLADNISVVGATVNYLVVDGIEIDPSGPVDTNVLKYDASLNKYIPGVASTVASLDDLTDVVISSATPNQVLKYDGTNWVNATAPSGAGGSVYVSTIGDGSTSTFTLTHGLSTRDIVVSITEAVSPYSAINTTWEATTLNTLTVYFDSAPSSNSVRVAVYGAVSGVSYPSLSGSMYSGYHGNGVDSTIEVNHGMGTRDIFVQVRNASSPYEIYDVAWESTTTNKLTLYFDSEPALDSVYVMVYAALSGVASTSIGGLTDVSLSGLDTGDFLRYNGSEWINDPVNLSTDTVGEYTKSLVAGTGVIITNNSGEGATPTIAIGQDVANSATPTFGALNVSGEINSPGITITSVANLLSLFVNSIEIDPSSASSGQGLVFNGTKFVPGTVSSSSNTRDVEIKIAMDVN